jgi:DNA mismatch repair protein MutS
MSLITEYFQLTKKYKDEYGPNTILLMQVGSFFEVYGIYDKSSDTVISSSITDFSQICELNMVEKNTCVGENNVMMAGFKDFQIEKYVKKIQDAGFSAVVYTQDENVKNTTRSLAGIFSPGTYFQPDSTSLTNSTTCIWVDYIDNKVLMKGKFVVVGVANIDIYTGKTTIFQFKETYINNPTTFDELERFISIYNPSEVILISNLPEEKNLDNIISYAGISCSLVHKIHINEKTNNLKLSKTKNCEKQSYQKEILSKFYKFDSFDVFIQNFNENNIATQSFCYLLDFVYEHNPQLVNKIFEPTFENCSTRLILANHSLKQLNIINDGTVKPSKLSSVSDLLNDCSTQMGKRRFLYNILNPVNDETILKKEYDITEHFLKNIDFYNNQFKQKLKQIKDLSKFERQIFLKKIPPKSFYTMYLNIQIINDIFNIVKDDETIINYFKDSDKDILEIGKICEHLSSCIFNNIDIDLAKDIDQMSQFETNFIKQGVDSELDKKTETLKESELKLESIREYLSNQIENKEKKLGKSSDYVKIHETDKNNYGLVSTSRRCKILQESLPAKDATITLCINFSDKKPKQFPFIISKNKFSFEKQSASNNFIIDDQIMSVCKSISSTKISMKDLITLIYNRFIDNFGANNQKMLDQLINFITLIDVVYTKASIAHKYNYCKPEIVCAEKSFVEAKGLRHCLIEQFQANELYVKNDISLGDGQSDGVLLYGTNAVGKTTLIRALGISVILAQAGLFVPCSSYRFKPYKHIFTRIIGNDNIFKGLSTFEVEMSELRTILRSMDENSLVLGDELCSGTETVSAISIFVAGIGKLYKCKSSFIFATHLHEIVDYEEITSLESVHLKHMEVKYDKESDSLIYDRKLKDGPGNNMYGLEVCKSLNLPYEFLEAANNIRLKYNPDGKSILSLKQSRYNSNKIVNMCEKCGKSAGTEVHHLQHQADSNENGIIESESSTFHKNNLANLMTLCEACHNEIHKKGTKQKKVKTSKGVKVINIERHDDKL